MKAVLVSNPDLPKPDNSIRLCLISDTHGLHGTMNLSFSPVDILVHAGDLTNIGELDKVDSVRDWLLSIPATQRIIIAGNHDLSFDPNCTAHQLKRLTASIPISEYKSHITNVQGITYLEETGTEVMGIKFWGTPFSPYFQNWGFQIRADKEMEYYSKIPTGTNVLVSHGPPYGVLDESSRGQKCGAKALNEMIEQVKPALVVCGHIHEAYGTAHIGDTLIVNASIMGLSPKEVHQPLYVDLIMP